MHKPKILFKRIRLATAIVLMLICLLAFYANQIETRRLRVHEETLTLTNWSANLDNFKIVAVSDIHGGSQSVDGARIRTLVETINRQNPDLIVLLGDYVSQTRGRSSDLKMPSAEIAESLKGLQAKYGVYAIIGNHDWWYNEAKITGEFEAAGITILDNETKQISVGGETVTLWGIEDFWKKRRVPLEPFDQIAEKKNIIALTHNPDSFDQTPPEVALMLAGHTHGGQVRIPFYGAPITVSQRKYYTDHLVENDHDVYITSGFGTTGPPFRFLTPPEIAVLTLKSRK